MHTAQYSVFRTVVRTVVTEASRLLSSSRCLACGEPLTGTGHASSALCPLCLSTMESLRIQAPAQHSAAQPGAERCACCGVPLISERKICMRCRERDYSFDSHVSVFMYRGVVKEMLQAYKFERRRELAATFARFVAGLLHERALENTVVVPSPPRSSAKRCRGWEHVQDIVRYLERDYHIPVLHLLSRRGGKTQKRLDYPGRRENIRGKIAARTGVRVPSQLVFFDDVFTTGSTADECATVLRKIGAERVDVVTVAMD